MAKGQEGGTPTPEEKLRKLLLEYSHDLETKELSLLELLYMFRDMGAAIEQVPEAEEAIADGIAEVGSQICTMAEKNHGVDLKALDGEVDAMLRYGGTDIDTAIKAVVKKHEPKQATETEEKKGDEKTEHDGPGPGETAVDWVGKKILAKIKDLPEANLENVAAKIGHLQKLEGDLPVGKLKKEVKTELLRLIEVEAELFREEDKTARAAELEKSKQAAEARAKEGKGESTPAPEPVDVDKINQIETESRIEKLEREATTRELNAEEKEKLQRLQKRWRDIEREDEELYAQNQIDVLRREIGSVATIAPERVAKLLRLSFEYQDDLPDHNDTKKRVLEAARDLLNAFNKSRNEADLRELARHMASMKPEETPENVPDRDGRLGPKQPSASGLDKIFKTRYGQEVSAETLQMLYELLIRAKSKQELRGILRKYRPIVPPEMLPGLKGYIASRGKELPDEDPGILVKNKSEPKIDADKARELETKRKELRLLFGSLKDHATALEESGGVLRTRLGKLKELDPTQPDSDTLAVVDTLINQFKSVLSDGADNYISRMGSNPDPGIMAMEKGIVELRELTTRTDAEIRVALERIRRAGKKTEGEKALRESLKSIQAELKTLLGTLADRAKTLRELAGKIDALGPGSGVTGTQYTSASSAIETNIAALQDSLNREVDTLSDTGSPNLRDFNVELGQALNKTRNALPIADREIARAERELKDAEAKLGTEGAPLTTERRGYMVSELTRLQIISKDEVGQVEAIDKQLKTLRGGRGFLSYDLRQRVTTHNAVLTRLIRDLKNSSDDWVTYTAEREATESAAYKKRFADIQKETADLIQALRDAKTQIERLIEAARPHEAAATEGAGAEGAPEHRAGEETRAEGAGAETGGEAAGAETREAGPSHTERMVASFKRYGISQEQLSTITDFDRLSEGQQIFALQNLKQEVLGRIVKAAETRYKDEFAQSGFFRGFFKRIKMRIWKQDYLDKHKREVASEFKEDGEANKSSLRDQVRRLRDGGPEVTLEVMGAKKVLKIHWFSEKFVTSSGGATDPKILRLVRNFNKAADKFAQIPQSWGQPGSRNVDAGWYVEYRQRFLRARDALTATLEKTESSIDLLERVEAAEAMVKDQQELIACPGDATKEIIRLLG